MNGDFNYFQLSEAESGNSTRMLVRIGGWIALLFLVISAGVHAVSLVISQVGMQSGVMFLIRIVSPVLVEVIAAVVAVGFASHAWRGPQKPVGLLVELLWLAFAALNLLTSFTLESGGQVVGLLAGWLHYGLPLSALLAGALFYAVYRLDPEHRRQAELQATGEVHRMAEFAARREVLTSPQMASVLRQRGWLAVVADLERQGFSPEQIAFMLADVPQLGAVTGQPVTIDAPKQETTPSQPAKPTAVPNHEPPKFITPHHARNGAVKASANGHGGADFLSRAQ